ncbi:TPA: hypothetical protein NJ631_000735 [Vibrio parahaemolyticus]|uniref:hypothetical protein n=1 Tax=Vibrio parahaemolyticus TaxID=670 RepID=UPI000B79468E|nr:hypothetical protein [Vibrio parahaemolyticus]OXD05805.1 hypothetical protein CA166_18210 [Vibrio parahaemolyticus]HCG9067655.1 hypothetical protein [Vibrio parahaemolyticus]HCG9617356.1 hypothetical protein [Vibrio parahaemolyticus]
MKKLPTYKAEVQKFRTEFSKWENEKKSAREKLNRTAIAKSDEGEEQIKLLLMQYENTELSNTEVFEQAAKKFNDWIDEKINTP